MSKTVSVDQRIDTILDYWFGTIEESTEYMNDKVKLWFYKDSKTDTEICHRFAEDVQRAANLEIDHWKETARGRLALIILLDQFPRNIYRGSAQAYCYDTLAIEIAIEGLRQNQHEKLSPIEKVFYYLPFEHSENLMMQQLSLSLFQQLKDEAPDHLKQTFESYYEYALRHYKIIAKFGRFPHRNAVLGRTSTKEEIEFLKQPGSSF